MVLCADLDSCDTFIGFQPSDDFQPENREKEQALKTENERMLSLLIEENSSQEALMLAKHEGEERAARKAEVLQTERNVSPRPSAPSPVSFTTHQPQVPECPVGD